MIIGIDGNEANTENKVGVHQYAYEILCGLYKQNNEKKTESSKHHITVYLKEAPKKDLPVENEYWQYKVLPGGKVWIVTRLTPHLLVNNNLDLFFTPSHYAPPIVRCPVVTTIHDLGYLESMEQFRKYDYWQLKLWTAKSISLSSALISVSQSTKHDLVRHYPDSNNKIHVVHHGYDKSRFVDKQETIDVRRTKVKFGIRGDYILFLSTLKPSKNVEGLVEAFSKLLKRYSKPVTLVIAGKKGWLYDSVFERAKTLGLAKRVLFTDFVDEEDKPALYYGAKLFALPVFWEGFGMTALESMASGTPVLVSKQGGLPEVVGDVGEYVDPYDSDDIARGLEKMLSLDKQEYNKLVVASLKQASKFSWEKAAKETLEVFESVIQ